MKSCVIFWETVREIDVRIGFLERPRRIVHVLRRGSFVSEAVICSASDGDSVSQMNVRFNWRGVTCAERSEQSVPQSAAISCPDRVFKSRTGSESCTAVEQM